MNNRKLLIWIKKQNIDAINLVEKFDVERANKLLLTDLLDDKQKKMLKDYIKGNKEEKTGKVKVHYYNEGEGRLKAINENTDSGICQMYMSKKIKKNILKNYYTDIDIKKCHRSIYIQLCNYHNIECNKIKYLLNDKFINMFYDKYKISSDEFKSLCIPIFNGGNVPKKYVELQEILSEIKTSSDALLNIYPEYYMIAEEKHGEDYWNLDGCGISYLLQQVEKQILLNIYKYFINNKFTVGALIHDGLHVEGKVNKKTLIACEEYIKNNTPFTIELVEKEFIEDKLDVNIAETDYEASQLMLDRLNVNKTFVYCKSRNFLRYDNVYTTNEKQIKNFLLRTIMKANIYKIVETEKGSKYITMTKNLPPAKKILETVLVNVDIDEEFYKKLWTSTKQKLCYNNGYYDFVNNKFKPYDDKTFTTIKINKDFEPAEEKYKKLVYDKILNPIFDNNKELIEFQLKTWARAIAGHTEDKVWGLCLGNRNSGKGVLVNLFENCFEDYIYTTNSNNFILKPNNGGDEAKAMSWTIPLEFKRLCFTNELKIDSDGSTKLDGNMIKKISSGGDVLQARLNHQDEITFKPQGTMFMMANDIPKIEPADALQTCVEIHCPSQFVDNPKENGIVKEYKKDDTIKDLIQEPEIIKAFTEILFSYYRHEKPPLIKICQEIKQENEQESELNVFKNMFNFTNDQNDFVKVSQLNSMIKNSSITASTKKVKMWLKGLKIVATAKTINSKTFKVYKGMKVKEDENDNIIHSLDM